MPKRDELDLFIEKCFKKDRLDLLKASGIHFKQRTQRRKAIISCQYSSCWVIACVFTLQYGSVLAKPTQSGIS